MGVVLVRFLFFCMLMHHGLMVFISDPERSLDDWVALGKPTLVLKCQQLGLSQTGTISELANSLCEFFQASTPVLSAANSSLASIPPPIAAVVTRTHISTTSTSSRSSGARSRRIAADPNAGRVQDLLDQNPAHLVNEPLVPVRDPSQDAMAQVVAQAVRSQLNELLPSIIESCSGAVNPRPNEAVSIPAISEREPPFSNLPWNRGLQNSTLPFRDLSFNQQQQDILFQHGGSKRKSKKSKKLKKSKKRKLAKLFSSSSSSSSSSESESEHRGRCSNRANLPPLDSSLIRRIAAGKKVDFDLLLPCSSALRSEGFELRHSHGDGGVYFAPKTKTKAKVLDFFTWCQAWSVFALYYTFYHAHRAAELWGYFHLAAEFATKFIWSNFENYDFQFRTAMEEDRKKNLLRWDRIDENLKSRFLTVSKPVCFNCRNFGHRSPQCPFLSSRRGISNVNPDSGAQFVPSATTATVTKKSAVKDKIYYCFNFNNGNCDESNCKYSHTCQLCGKDHAKAHCPSRN